MENKEKNLYDKNSIESLSPLVLFFQYFYKKVHII